MKLSLIVASLFLLSVLLENVHAVDRSKFKTCSQSSFCKRNRAPSDQKAIGQRPLYNVTEVQLQKTKITAKLVSPYTDKPLNLEVLAYEDNSVRLRILENDPRRYVGPSDVLLPLKEAIFTEISKSSTNYVFSLNNRVKGEITFVPFKLDWFVDGEPAITANQRNLINYEHLRTREEDALIFAHEITSPEASKPETWIDETDGPWEAPKVPNPDAEGRWDETFGGSHRDSKPYGPTSVGMDFTFHDSQHVYGIPEHATNLALKSTKDTDPYRLYNLDVFEYELNNEMALYGSIPYMISHSTKRTNGIFWFNSAETWIDVNHGSAGYFTGKDYVDTHWFSESGIVDVFFFLGPKPADIFRQYSLATGTAPVPPLFSIAYHQCKWNYKDQREVAEVDTGFDTNNIPYDVIWLDIEHTDGKAYFTWDKNNFPTPKDMQSAIAGKGRKMVTIVDPHIKRDNNYYIHQAAQAAGDLYIKTHDKREYDGHCWPGSSSWIDYTSEKSRNWWSERFSYDIYQHSTPTLYTWNDMNEPSVFNGPEVTMHKDAIHAGDVEHRDVHNVYGMYMHMATAQGLINRNSDKNERPFVLSRAFFAGTQRWGAVWTGDNAAQWDHLSIAQPMLLSLGVAGLSFAGADVGGFFGNPEGELLTRWYQAGAFYPFFRAHAHLDSKRREPWLVENYMNHIREAIRTRYTFLPFWYTQFYNHSITGLPIIRPMWIDYDSDSKLFEEQNQFLVGRDLLVRPVSSQGSQSVEVHLPGNQPWYDFVDNYKYNAPQTIKVNTPIEKIVVFQRGGSIIPKKERTRRSSSLTIHDPYTLLIALDSNSYADGDLYVDDFHSYNYQNQKQYLRRKFIFNKNKINSINIDKEGGQYQIENTIERIVIYGYPEKVNKIVLNNKIELGFVNENNQKLIIRKPDVKITEDWEISIL